MADVRALLKAKRQDARVVHPHATYNSSGQLKCSVCGSFVKHSFAWEGHLGSKTHRTNALRLRDEERQNQENNAMHDHLTEITGKRKLHDDLPDNDRELKKRRHQLPQDFFSDPSHAPPEDSEQESDDDDVDNKSAPQASLLLSSSDVELEYKRFQRELLNTNFDSETYDRATIFAEPVSLSAELTGFPHNTSQANADVITPVPDESLEDARLKHENDERELIMDRLLEEERAQEDADTRVQLLKMKVEELQRKRKDAKQRRTALE